MLLNAKRVSETQPTSLLSCYEFYQRSSDTSGGRYRRIVACGGIYGSEVRMKVVHETVGGTKMKSEFLQPFKEG